MYIVSVSLCSVCEPEWAGDMSGNRNTAVGVGEFRWPVLLYVPSVCIMYMRKYYAIHTYVLVCTYACTGHVLKFDVYHATLLSYVCIIKSISNIKSFISCQTKLFVFPTILCTVHLSLPPQCVYLSLPPQYVHRPLPP